MRLKFFAALAAVAAVAALITSTPAVAEVGKRSLWDHNGSLMRLVANGNLRTFIYVDPRPGLAVQPGAVLFNGYREGDRYIGTARVFSRFCPDAPLRYRVEGFVAPGGSVILMGERPVHVRCNPTGRIVTDRLEFHYLRLE